MKNSKLLPCLLLFSLLSCGNPLKGKLTIETENITGGTALPPYEIETYYSTTINIGAEADEEFIFISWDLVKGEAPLYTGNSRYFEEASLKLLYSDAFIEPSFMHYESVTVLNIIEKFNDIALREVMKEFEEDLLSHITELNLANLGIEDLTGIEVLWDLTTIDLSDNPIEDITPLYALGALTNVNLGGTLLSSEEITHFRETLPGVVIESAPYVEYLEFEDPGLGEYLAGELGDTHILEVTTLDIRGEGITSLGGIENFTSLTTLKLVNNNITDLSPLISLINLTELDLNNNNIESLYGIETLKSLEILNLKDNPISSFSALKHLTNLTSLNLAMTGCNDPADFRFLAPLTRLRSLSLDSNTLTDLSGISNCPGLTLLSHNTNSVADFSPIAGLAELEEISLSNTDITDLPSLAAILSPLEFLSTLDLSRNSITGLTPLSSLIRITVLKLSENSITDVTGLDLLVNLEELDLNTNLITDITPLGSLTKLNLLELGDNSIANIYLEVYNLLSKLPDLTDLYLNNNLVLASFIDDLRNDFPGCNIYF